MRTMRDIRERIAQVGLSVVVTPSIAVSMLGYNGVGAVPLLSEPEQAKSSIGAPAPQKTGVPESITPTTLKPTEAILRWTPTGSAGIEDTYDVRIGTVNQIDGASSGNFTPIRSEYGRTSADFDVTSIPENTYVWQVRSCDGTTLCTSWSPLWALTIDGTPPRPPTARVTSNLYDTTVSVAGEAEAGSRIGVSVNKTNICIVQADTTGQWLCTLQGELEYGNYEASIISTDTAGNQSDATELVFTVRESFEALQITEGDLPPAFSVIPVDESLENTVYQLPVNDQSDTRSVVPADRSSESDGVLSAEGGIIQSSENGWRVMGAPWYVWLGALSGVGGGWWLLGLPGSRRLGSFLSI